MKTILVNLYDLDPPINGGMSRVAYLVSRLLAEYAELGYVDVYFAVGLRFSVKFREWLGHQGGTLIPVLYEADHTPLLNFLEPDITVNPLFGLFPPGNFEGYNGRINIATMPDALALDKPNLFSEIELAQRLRKYDQLRAADWVVTISNHARSRLIHHLELKEDRVIVAPLAGNDLNKKELNISSSVSQGVAKISSPFILYPANGWPHKRHELLLRIMNQIWKVRPELSLVLTGWKPEGYINELASRYKRYKNKVLDLGYVKSDIDLTYLYQNAEAMIFVSEYEGFCMPVLEAMMNQCPVICAPIGSIPEVAGEAALFVDSIEPVDWASAFLNELPKRRVDLINLGNIKSTEYSWDKTKEKWVELFASLGVDSAVGRKGQFEASKIPMMIISSELQTWAEKYADLYGELKRREMFNQLGIKNATIRQIIFFLFDKLSAVRNYVTWIENHLRIRYKLGVTNQYQPRPPRIMNRYNEERGLPDDRLPIISIVTPSYNQALFLERTIKSVFSQEYPKLEYIIQDGNSTDGSKAVIEKYRKQLTHSESISDGGQANAINLGFRRSTGEIMAYLNSDDMFLPKTLHFVAKYFSEHPQVDVVYGHRIIVDENDQEVGIWVLPPHDKKMLEWGDYVPQESLFWRRRIWDKCGGKMDESFKFALDWDLLIRFQQAGANIVRLPRFLGMFRVHDAQKSTALMNELGVYEINLIHKRIHGREVQKDEINKNLQSYLMRSLVYHNLYRMGFFRY